MRDVKEWFLDQVSVVKDMAKDAADSEVTIAYLNAYLRAIADLEENTIINMDSFFTINCFVVDRRQITIPVKIKPKVISSRSSKFGNDDEENYNNPSDDTLRLNYVSESDKAISNRIKTIPFHSSESDDEETSPKVNKNLKSKLDNQIYLKYNKLIEENNEDEIVKFIINNYSPNAYFNINFVTKQETEYGYFINSFIIRNGNSIDNGLQIFVNGGNNFPQPGVPFRISSYQFYDQGKIVENNLQEVIYSNHPEYLINNKYITNNAENEPIYSILEYINNKLLNEKVYPWLLDFINDEDENIMTITKIKNDEVKFLVPDENTPTSFNDLLYRKRDIFVFGNYYFKIIQPQSLINILNNRYCFINIDNKYFCFCKLGNKSIYFYGWTLDMKVNNISSTNKEDFFEEIKELFHSFNEKSDIKNKIINILNETNENFEFFENKISSIEKFLITFKTKNTIGKEETNDK